MASTIPSKQLPNLPANWRGDLVALAAGPLVTLSLAPWDYWPLGIAACFLLLWSLDNSESPRALKRGWLFGLGMFGTGISWVYVSIHEHGNASVPLALLLVGLFTAGLALLPALMARLITMIRGEAWQSALAFTALWTLFEWLRSWFIRLPVQFFDLGEHL